MKSAVEMGSAAGDARGDAPAVRVSGASYVRGGYRSFEFADIAARSGQVTVLLSGERALARDLLLAVAGAVRPTSGSLAVGDASFAAATGAGKGTGALRVAAAWRAFQRQLCATGTVGLGVFTGLTEVAPSLTVEEAVARELGHRRSVRAEAFDSLDFLARFGLATYADQRIERLQPDARARLSAALALAPAPLVAVVGLRDPFCMGLTADEEREVVRELRAIAYSIGAAVVVSCSEASSSADADAVFTLDIAAAEALSAVDAAVSARPVSEGVDA